MNSQYAVSSFAARLADLRARLRAAAERAGRNPDEITLLPVSKTFGTDALREAVAAGLTRFGENKVQEIRTKHQQLQALNLHWVMIGHLQTNKAKDVARLVTEVQSLDRQELAEALQHRLELENRSIDVLVQVKTASEPSKYGIEPDQLPDLLRYLSTQAPRLHVQGLMTMATNSPDPEEVRACFRRLRLLRDEMRQANLPGIALDRLSMGMSGDFELAIEEGSTEIRVGSALFGARSYETQ